MLWYLTTRARCLVSEPRQRPTAEEVYAALVGLMDTPHRSYAGQSAGSSKPVSVVSVEATGTLDLVATEAPPTTQPAAVLRLGTGLQDVDTEVEAAGGQS
jgi:hypothetical protein